MTTCSSLSELPIVQILTVNNSTLPKGPHSVYMPNATECTLFFSAKCEISTWQYIKISNFCIFRIELLLFPHNCSTKAVCPLFNWYKKTWSDLWWLSFSWSSPSESFLGSTFKIFLDSAVSHHKCHSHFGLRHYHSHLGYWNSFLRCLLSSASPCCHQLFSTQKSIILLRH